MRLLVSPNTVDEALVCAAAARYLDIVDVKNTKEGSLGANYPWVITAVREAVPSDKQVSATLGDVPFKPGTVAQAGLGAAVAGASYIKAGLYGCPTPEHAIEVMQAVVRAVKDYKPDATVVAAGYADAHRVGSLSPMAIPYVAHKAAADVAMVDTAIKDGTSLFDHMSLDECAEFVKRSHAYGLTVALAGSVKAEHLKDLASIGTDIIGVRGAVCGGGDRNTGKIQEGLIAAFRQAMDESMRAAVA
jgi:(5-formylfuran-3-yl)methyl phosphate synthase